MQFKDKKGNLHISNQYAVTANIKSDFERIQKKFTKEKISSKTSQIKSMIVEKKDEIVDTFKVKENLKDVDSTETIYSQEKLSFDNVKTITMENTDDENTITIIDKGNEILFKEMTPITDKSALPSCIINVCNGFVLEDNRNLRGTIDELFQTLEVKTIISDLIESLSKNNDMESRYKDLTISIDEIINIFMNDDGKSNIKWIFLFPNFYQLISSEVVDRIFHPDNYK